jgi:predicted hotdog family 3-hydroxylacyl-ACP dehydratase
VIADLCGADEIRALMLHAERMVLWQAVEHWDDAGIRCRTLTHCDPENPLRRGNQLASIHLGEYGAQLMALHGALLARKISGGKLAPGVLTSLRDFELAAPQIENIRAPLLGTARMLVSGASGSIYEFAITAEDRRLASGRVSVITLLAAAQSA